MHLFVTILKLIPVEAIAIERRLGA